MQSNKRSIFEVFCDVGSGFMVALITWEYIIEPLFHIQKDFMENIGITCIFTAIGVTRKFIWRRLFNRWDSK